MTSEILHPVVALVCLNCFMLIWMFAVRLPALNKMGYVPDPDAPRGAQMSELPARVRWKGDNYDHLLEQPTLFYALAISMALLGAADQINIMLAWGYVGLRVVHSIVQATFNNVMLRFGIFALYSILLIAMAVRAALFIWG